VGGGKFSPLADLIILICNNPVEMA